MSGRESMVDDDRMRVVDIRSCPEVAIRGFRSGLRSGRRGEPRPSLPRISNPGRGVRARRHEAPTGGREAVHGDPANPAARSVETIPGRID